MRTHVVTSNLFLFFTIIAALLPASALACAGPPLTEDIMVVHTTSLIPTVNNTTGNVTGYSMMSVGIAITFSFGLFVIALWTKDPFLFFVSGITWVFSGVFVFVEYSIGWMIITVPIGLYAMLMTGFQFKNKTIGGK